jgi:predicted PolB exonuclease-like 3'-5' exonuclease
MHYYYYPESIVTAGTSWVGDNFETVLLYGSLREAYTYLKGEQDLIANYEAKYQEAMTQLMRLGDGLNRRDAYRSGQVRVPVTS